MLNVISQNTTFPERLNKLLLKYNNPLCIGIDPHPDLMHPLFGGPNQDPLSEKTLINLENFCTEIVTTASSLVPAVKPQVALFERYGSKGMEVLRKISILAQKLKLIVIMDAKRGDIGSTSRAYAEAWLGKNAVFPSDALTINPYLGVESIIPFVEIAKKTNSGLFVLTKTSNKGSSDFQELLFEKNPLWEKVAMSISPIVIENEKLILNSNFKLSSVGIVVGASGKYESKILRDILPTAPFLVPGFGAQGGSAKDALSGIIRDDGSLAGLINSSRNITHNKQLEKASNLNMWKKLLENVIKITTNQLQEIIYESTN